MGNYINDFLDIFEAQLISLRNIEKLSSKIDYRFSIKIDKNECYKLGENAVSDDTFKLILDKIKDEGKYEKFMSNRKVSLFYALLNDFVNYLDICLHALKKRTFEPAYAISRKPLQDNLFFLEWLLIDGDNLLENVLYEDISSYTHKGKGVNFKKRQLEHKNKLKNINIVSLMWIFMVDDSFKYRYDKNASDGLESLWQSSNHLITTFGFDPTKSGSFNHLLNDYFNKYEFAYYFVKKMIYLLYYTTTITFEILKMFKCPPKLYVNEKNQTTLLMNKFIQLDAKMKDDIFGKHFKDKPNVYNRFNLG